MTVFGLHLRGSTRGWFMSWLGRSHPELVSRYRELYRRGAYLPQDYREMLRRRAAPLVAKHGLTGDRREFTAPPAAAEKVSQPCSRRCSDVYPSRSGALNVSQRFGSPSW